MDDVYPCRGGFAGVRVHHWVDHFVNYRRFRPWVVVRPSLVVDWAKLLSQSVSGWAEISDDFRYGWGVVVF